MQGMPPIRGTGASVRSDVCGPLGFLSSGRSSTVGCGGPFRCRPSGLSRSATGSSPVVVERNEPNATQQASSRDGSTTKRRGSTNAYGIQLTLERPSHLRSAICCSPTKRAWSAATPSKTRPGRSTPTATPGRFSPPSTLCSTRPTSRTNPRLAPLPKSEDAAPWSAAIEPTALG